jgi:hypothetical protein
MRRIPRKHYDSSFLAVYSPCKELQRPDVRMRKPCSVIRSIRSFCPLLLDEFFVELHKLVTTIKAEIAFNRCSVNMYLLAVIVYKSVKRSAAMVTLCHLLTALQKTHKSAITIFAKINSLPSACSVRTNAPQLNFGGHIFDIIIS